jgi:hypothetical protein
VSEGAAAAQAAVASRAGVLAASVHATGRDVLAILAA